ncbi:hypothetical protein C8T65DRAFT_32958 [Cerioporus squamosus]|nr:hypothetical protein C8T65DRAFT_32958 [Cerioporus squamosus]
MCIRLGASWRSVRSGSGDGLWPACHIRSRPPGLYPRTNLARVEAVQRVSESPAAEMAASLIKVSARSGITISGHA